MTTGSAARLLRADLDTRTVTSESLPSEWLRRFVGGKGLAARVLYEELAPGTDPLGPENVLLFAVGPLTGVLPGDARYAVVTKSPQTGGFLDTYAGGNFPARLAGALDDHLLLLVTGAADTPVRLEIEHGSASIEPAEDWWGLDTVELAEQDPDAAVAGIGPAGEHRVTYATIASDGGDHHAGRGGAGAVMGAKRLKAVVARGKPPALPEALGDLYDEAESRYETSPTGRWQRSGGTAESVDFADAVGGLATRGWRSSRFNGTEDVGIEAVKALATGRERSDDAVPGDFQLGADDRLHRGAASMTLGAGLGIANADDVNRLAGTCDRLGLDLVSAGNVLAWVIRASEAGHLDSSLRFGDPEGARTMLEAIATRDRSLIDGIAEGVDAAADRHGGQDLVPSVKGLELPNYDPRVAPSMALAYATSDRGACHRRARPIECEPFDDEWSPVEAARAVIAEQNSRAANWCLIADDFAGAALDDNRAEWLAALDYPADASSLASLGERTWTLTRLFNVREGWRRADDTLPAVLTEPPADDADGPVVAPEQFEAMLDAYYAQRDWGPDGRPSSDLVKRLGLSTVVTDRTQLADRPSTPPGDD